MKTLMMVTAATATLAASALSADAQAIRVRDDRHGWGVEVGRRHDAPRCEQVLVGYRDEIVGYEDVWVERPVTTYEMRTVYRSVFVGYDHCRRPIYRTQPVCEQVPVCSTQRVCEKRPICEKRPVYETREICREPSYGFRFSFGR